VPNILSLSAAQSYFSKYPNLCCQESSVEPLSKVISDALTLLNDTEGDAFQDNKTGTRNLIYIRQFSTHFCVKIFSQLCKDHAYTLLFYSCRNVIILYCILVYVEL